MQTYSSSTETAKFSSSLPLHKQESSTPPNRFAWISRWKAALVHLSISACLALAAVLLLYFVWYPQPFFEASGAKPLLLLLVGVDVVLGPLITLIIFNPKKKSLPFDLAVIAAIQLAALVYGMYTVFQARPVYVVYAQDRFEVVAANDLLPAELARVTREEFKSLPLLGPKLVGAVFPTDPEEKGRVLSASFGEGGAIQAFPQHYVPIGYQFKEVLEHGKPLADLIKRNRAREAEILKTIQSLGYKTADLLFLPVRAKDRNFAALIDAKTGEVVGYALVDPSS